MLENKEIEALVTKTTEHQESVIAMIDLELEHAAEIEKLATQAGDVVVNKGEEEDEKRVIVETMREFAKDIRQRHHNFLASPKSLVKQISIAKNIATSMILDRGE